MLLPLALLAPPVPQGAHAFTPPTLEGDVGARPIVEEALRAAFSATAGQGAWPPGAWAVLIHPEAGAFERATGAPPGRAAQWLGSTLHLRPWEQLRRRDLGAILRHELTHRRLAAKGLRRWEEEARCLFAEAHRRPLDIPAGRPPAGATLERPTGALQDRLDRALAGGTTREQAWVYRWLRAWLKGGPLPPPPEPHSRPSEVWVKEAATLADPVTVVWPAERLRGPLVVNGVRLPHRPGRSWRFRGHVLFSQGFPVRDLRGAVRVQAAAHGWRVAWTASRSAWIAAATEGELGADAPPEAQRALAAVLRRWLEGHGHQHPGGALCPLTHCAVVRGAAADATLAAAASAPDLPLDPRWAFFTGSAGGRGLSPREVWGEGPADAGNPVEVPGDRWSTWERTLGAAEVAALKRDVRPGLKPGQRGLNLGDSGPYAVEALRLAAGRRFGWTAWPGNACEGEVGPDGTLRLRGRGWGHNAGLCLATARFRAAQGATAEQILDEAFPASWRTP